MSDTSEQRVALITGASRGIGYESALRLAAQGRLVVCVGRKQQTLDAVVSEIESKGGAAKAVTCDVCDGEQLNSMIETVSDELGRLDILVNNAGMTQDNLLMRMTDAEFDEVIAANLRSVFVACRAALRPMMRKKWGRIINISSVAGVIGNSGQTNYAAAKSGVIGFTKSLAREMASKQITANVIAPGFIETAMTHDLPQPVKDFAISATPLKRFGQADEIAAAVAFLTSEDAGYITGQTLSVDGGMSMS